MIASTTTFKHILHFTTNERMDYASNILSTFSKLINEVESAEFDGDDLNEVYFETSKPLPQKTINKILNHLGDVSNSKFNY